MRSILKLVLVMVITVGIALSVSACSAEDIATNNDSIQITDQAGRTVTLSGTPQRIISIAPANTEILFALGLDDKIVGVTSYCNYPEEALGKEQVGGFSTPDIEKIVVLEPDVVFAAPIHETTFIPQLENRGITVIALTPKTIDETYDAIELVGTVTGAEESAAALIEDMRSRIDIVTELVTDLSDDERPNVLYIVWHEPFMTAGSDSLAGQLIDLAGGKNIFSDLSGYATPKDPVESILDKNPNIIIVGTGMGSGANAPLVWAQSESRLQITEALEEGKVYSINTDLTGRFGPRVVDALYEMFNLIHPDLAAHLD